MAKKKKSKKTLATDGNRWGTIFLLIGTLLLSVWGLHKFLYIRSLTLSLQHTVSFASQAPPTAYPSEIRVGDFVTLPVVPAGYVNGEWLISPKSANHVTKSASPGEPGNIIIYAHNKPSMFGPLHRVQKGDMISVKTNDGSWYEYKITDIQTVAPSDTTLLNPTSSEILTLYTCTGFLDSKRLVIRGIPTYEHL